MKIHNAQYKVDDSSILNYYQVGADKNKLLLLHAQGYYNPRFGEAFYSQ